MKFIIKRQAYPIFKDSFLREAVKHPIAIFDTEWSNITLNESTVVIFDFFTVPLNHIKEMPSDIEVLPLIPFIKYGNYVDEVDLSELEVSYPSYSNHPMFTCYTNGRDLTDHRFDPMIIPDDEGNCYSLPTKRVIKVQVDHAKQQIKSRYVFTDRPSSGLMNTVIDSFYPGLLFKYDMNPQVIQQTETFPKTSYTISPFISSLTGIKELPFEDTLAHLGYNSRSLKQLLTTVKRKKLTFIFAGVGGTGSNTIYWLSKMCDHVNLVNLFDKVYAFEKESIEISNTLRFPFAISEYHNNSRTRTKLDLVVPYLNKLSTKVPETDNRYLSKNSPSSYYSKDIFFNGVIKPNHVIYGAPSLDMRNEISDLGPFIAATHSSNECSLWLNPRQEDDLALETYGLIQLAPFFMNQIKLVLATLELLASDQDLTEQDKHIMDFSFNGSAQSRTSRVYNWQIQETALVMTDEQANAI